jgi:diguanylate cyclase (GGDEF)-like protein/PAS domain S-box-containing protein
MGKRAQPDLFGPLPSLLLDLLDQAVVEVTTDGRIASWNTAAETMFGRPHADVIGKSWEGLGLLWPDKTGWDVAHQEQARGTAEPRRCKASRSDGTTFPVMVVDAVVPAENGEAARTIRLITDLTGRDRGDCECDLRDARWQALISRSADVACIADELDQRITYVSPAVTRLFGWQPEEIVGQLGRAFVHPQDAERVADALALVKSDPSAHPTVAFRLLCADGSYRWVEETLSNMVDVPGVRGLVTNIRDVHDRRAAQEGLRASEARYRLIAETAQEGIHAVDISGRTMYANQKLGELLGYPLDEIYAMRNFEVADLEARAELTRRLHARHSLGAECYELPYVKPDGSPVVLRISATPLFEDGRHLGSLAMVADVTDAREAERELRRRATQDPLTGLANRSSLVEQLQEALDASAELRGRRSVAVLVADIDQFKLINDTLGHPAGDALLIEVSRRWEAALRGTDILARFGGDEFVVLCPGANDEQAKRIAARLQRALRRPFEIAGRTVAINASIGIAVVSRGRIEGSAAGEALPDAGTVLGYADAAMYAAKAEGPGNSRVFSSVLISHSRGRLHLINDLRVALESDQLELNYQPVVDLVTGRLLGVEALCRWTHPERGVVPTSEFIVAAEESGLIDALDRWVLRRACRDGAAMRGDGTLPPRAYVAVNVFAGHLEKPGFETDLAIALAESGMPAGALVLEVTESAVMRDPDASSCMLERLQRLGIRVAIDDFGTGYSSLRRLSQLPMATLKIDRGFVHGIADHPDHRAIVTAVIDLGRALHITSTAEGIETFADLRLLKDLGCHAGQGFLWSPALPIPELAELLAGLRHGRFALAPDLEAANPLPLQRISPPGR